MKHNLVLHQKIRCRELNQEKCTQTTPRTAARVHLPPVHSKCKDTPSCGLLRSEVNCVKSITTEWFSPLTRSFKENKNKTRETKELELGEKFDVIYIYTCLVHM